MLMDSYEVPTLTTGARPLLVACGVVVPHLSAPSELSMTELAELKRKYSGLLIVFDRFRDHLLSADSAGSPVGEWSNREILGHMVDTDRQIWWPRITALLENDRPFLQSLDPEELLAEHGWSEQPIANILAQFMQFRWNCAIRIKDLTLQDFARTGEHYEFGEISVANILEILIAHDAHYLAALRRRLGMPEF